MTKYFDLPARAPLWFRIIASLLVLFLWAYAWAALNASGHELAARAVRFVLFLLLSWVWVPFTESDPKPWPTASRVYLAVLMLVCVPGVIAFDFINFAGFVIAAAIFIKGGRHAATNK